MSEQPTKVDQNHLDALTKASFDTLHTGRFMINANLTNLSKAIITTFLAEIPPDAIESYRKDKTTTPNCTGVVTLVDDPDTDKFRVGWTVIEPSINLEPEVAATMLKNMSRARPHQTVPFPASPQLDWLANWATFEAHGCMNSDLRNTSHRLSVDVANILHGLFCNADIVVILAVVRSHDPISISFHSVTEATITDDGKLVPTFDPVEDNDTQRKPEA